MHSIAWWPPVLAVVLAAIIDVWRRRIPNWLSLPLLLAGLVVSAKVGGVAGMLDSLAGIGLAALFGGVLWYLRGMGMGDLKLLAGVGAWVGPAQLLWVLLATGIIGGFLAVGYALWHGSLGRSLDGVAELVTSLPKRGLRPHGTMTLDNAEALKMPYAPAIAAGTILSFLAR